VQSIPKPPKDLSVEARKMWRDIIAEYGIDDAVGLRLLRNACESFDVIQAAQKEVRADGLLIGDGEKRKPHPLLPTMRDARSSMLHSLKALNCDLEPLRDRSGRPPGAGERG